jgi:hypothetical protein
MYIYAHIYVAFLKIAFAHYNVQKQIKNFQ